MAAASASTAPDAAPANAPYGEEPAPHISIAMSPSEPAADKAAAEADETAKAAPPAKEPADSEPAGPAGEVPEKLKTNYYVVLMLAALLLNVAIFAIGINLLSHAGVFELSGTMSVVNLLVLTMWRNEFFVCALFWAARLTKIEWVHRLVHNYGGVHASAGMCCLAWVVLSIAFGVESGAITTPILAIRIVIASLLVVVAAVGSKKLRHKYHNAFEIIHRYTSWLLLAILAADIIIQMPGALHTPVPYLWLATLLFLLSSWLTVTKEPCNVRLLSESNKRIVVVDMPQVKYRGAGLAIKLSRNGVEWHSFAVCPSFYSSGSMCVIAAAGDWTKQLVEDCIEGKAPEHIYTRSMFPGFMNSTNTFTKIACVGTGAGIAPILATIYTPNVEVKLLWVTNTKYDTADILTFLEHQKTPYHIFNTAVARPEVEDVMDEIPADVEAVFVVSNPEFTRQMKKYCNDRNVRCFGANWDS